MKDDKWITTRGKSKKEMTEAILAWEPKAKDLHFQDTHKDSYGFWNTHCWYTF